MIYLPLALLSEPLLGDLGFLGLSLLSSLFLVIFVAYFLLFEGLTSTTPGKRSLGLWVISLETLSRASFADSAVRNLLRVADALTLYLAIPFTGSFRMGDLAASTVVVSRDLLQLELPGGRSEIAEDMRKGIIEALSYELMSIDGWEGMIGPGTSTSAEAGGVGYSLPGVPDEVLRAAVALARRPGLSTRILGIEGIIRVYERASELCYHMESREILRNRATLMRAIVREPRRELNPIGIFTRGPDEFRRLAPYFLTSLALFLASLVAAYGYRPSWLEAILRELFGRGETTTGINPALLSLLILMNNLRVALTVVGTAPLIVLSPLVLAANGAMVGLVMAISKMGPLSTLGYILPHGVPELTAIFTSTSIALSAIKELLLPSSGGRLESAGRVVRGSLNALGLAVILIVVAGQIWVVGVVADLIAVNRRLIEEMLVRSRDRRDDAG